MGTFRPPRREKRSQAFRAHGITLIEVLVSLLAVGVVVVLLLPTGGRRGCGGRQLKDSTQIRGVQQGLTLWAMNNRDAFPLPSEIDAKNSTVLAEIPAEKDTTANIVSIMIFNGFFSPELCVSPAESNPNIKVFDSYQYTEPAAAVGADKKLALWDPAFSADFTKPGGNFSYGHAIPNGKVRRGLWKMDSQAEEPQIGNRGPEIQTLTRGSRTKVKATLKNPLSNTMLIHGGRKTWEGNIAYADNHVNMETDLFASSSGRTYTDSAGRKWEDCLFFDEPEDVEGKNSFLGVFVGAGKEPGDFKAIWD